MDAGFRCLSLRRIVWCLLSRGVPSATAFSSACRRWPPISRGEPPCAPLPHRAPRRRAQLISPRGIRARLRTARCQPHAVCAADRPDSRRSSRYRRDPVDQLQPALASTKALEILEALALLAGAAEVEFLDILVVAQFVGGSVEHDLALVHDVAVARDRQRSAGVLLDQQ